MIKEFLFLWVLVLSAFSISGQTVINGTVNDYVDIIRVIDPNCGDCPTGEECWYRIEVSDASAFNTGDRVLIVQMKGATIDVTNTDTGGEILDIGNAGNYEFFIIGKVDYDNNIIYPRGELKRTYDNLGLIQLVKVPTYSGDVEINSDLEADAWDPSLGKGGVIAIFVDGTLTLNADINVHGKGYQGVVVSTNGSPDNCTIDPATQMVKPSSDLDVSPKGQGIVIDDPDTNGGRAPRANGGGGGVSGDTGGGGGSNYGAGGAGGDRWCDTGGATAGGIGGLSMADYINTNRIYFGGAGGAGFVTNGNSATAANGGGLVVIRANKIISNGYTIDASGSSPSAAGTGIDGGGGGGGGGTVAFEIKEFEGTLNVNVSGGDGQDLATSTLHGPGGGGGGGAFLYNLPELPVGITVNKSGGEGGIHESGLRNGSMDGSEGAAVSYFDFVYSDEDSDNDGISDECDLDTDNDGIPDSEEDGYTGFDPSKDADGDGIANYRDTYDATDGFPAFIDTNNDWVNDVYDRDRDHIPDFRDLDSDNDGILDAVEAGGVADVTGVLANYADVDIDGLNDTVDPSEGGVPLSKPDFDSDGVPDFLDLDSDNDGVSDAFESRSKIMINGRDTDGDGIDDVYDTDQGGTLNTTVDHDGDGLDDMFDIDSDNDGITDYYEASGIGPLGLDFDSDGIDNVFDVDFAGGSDVDGDWIDDLANPDTDSDGDGLFDFIDIDSDGDGIVDNIEGQTTIDYIAPSGVDTDRDGLDNAYDNTNGGVIIVPTDTDGDAIPDFIDTNSDEDSESDMIEAYDINSDGVSDVLPAGTDTDGDGLDDSFDDVSVYDATDGGEMPTDYPDVDDPGDDRDWRQNLPRVTLSVDESIISENVQTATYIVTLSETTYVPVTINLLFSGDATSGSDYNIVPGVNASDETTIVIPAGELSGTVSVSTIDDAFVEDAERVILDISSVTNALEVVVQQKTVTISDNDAPGITVSTISNAINENGQTATFTIVLNSAPSDIVTISLSSDNTSEGQPSLNSVTFYSSDWNIPKEITVIPTDDFNDEPDRSFNIITGVAESTDSNYNGIAVSDVEVINIDDDDEPTLSFRLTSSSGAESISSASLIVDLSQFSGFSISVNYTVSGSAKGLGIDHALENGTLNIPAGSTSGTITISSIVDDLLDENNETVIVTLSSPANGILGTNPVHTYTIQDNDASPSIGFASASSSGSESVSSASLEVSLSAVSELAVSVNYTVTGTAGASDYTLADGSITIPAGSTSGTITISSIVDDLLDENNETVIVTLSSPANGTLGTNPVHTYTIQDNDASPSIGFASASSSGSESVSSASLEVSLSAVSELAVSVNYTVTGTAGASDYTLADGSITIPAGSTSGTITISSIVDDLLDENNETVIVTLSSPTNGTLGTNPVHTYTIQDNDASPSIGFASASSSGSESVSSASLEVSLSAVSELAVSVNYTVTGTAGASDYTLADGSITIPGGSTSGTITISSIVDDLLDENNETVIVTLSSPTNGTLGTNPVHTYTIQDNDASPSIGFALASSSGSESVSSTSLEVSLSAVSELAVRVNYTVTGTAGASDYTLADGSITIPGGSTSGTITISSIVDDFLDENNETVIVTLSSPTNGILGTNPVHTYTIQDNDASPSIGFASASSSGSESVSSASLEVSLSAVSELAVSVNYTVTGTAGASDYTLADGSITIPAGSTSGTITISSIVDDFLDENNETVIVTLSSPTNGILGTNPVHTYTIQDNDASPSIGFASASSSGSESVSSASLEVSLSAVSELAVSVNYTVTGTAGASDYTLADGSITIPAGSTSGTITISSIVDDFLDENNETVIVTLSSPTNGILGTNPVHTYTIQDNDASPSIGFASASSSGSESVSSASLEVSLSAVSELAVSVNYTVTGTAGASDYTLADGSITIPGGSTSGTITISSIVDDFLDENNETVIVTLSSPTNGTLGTNPVHTYTIQDNDASPSIGFASASSSGSESVSSASLDVTLSAVSELAVSVNYTVTGTAGASDYTLADGSITIPAGSTSGTITISSIVDDFLDENNETVIVTLSSPTNGTLGTNPVHTYTIQDNDASPSIGFASASSSGSESVSSASLEVSLSAVSELAVSVNYTVTGTAGASDYTLADGSITIPAGSTSGTITISSIVDDLLDENNETVIVTLSSPTNGILGTNPVHTYTIQDNDASPSIGFASASSSGSESVSSASLEVSLSAVSELAVSVNYTVTGTAGASDYTLADGSITIPAGSTSGTITISSVVDDLLDENNETVIVTLSSPTNGILGTNPVHTYTIQDNDASPSIGFASASSSGSESVSSASLEVSLSAVSELAVRVNYTVTGTAGASDYTLADGSITIPAGSTSGTITISSVVDDLLDENNETVIVTLSSPTNGTLGTNPVHTYTIQDNDASPSIGFASASSSGSESVSSASLDVTLSAVSELAVSVNYTVTGTAGASDYTLADGSITIPAGSTSGTITISSIVDDLLDENNETVIVTLSSPTNGTLGTNPVHTYTIIDNDETMEIPVANDDVVETDMNEEVVIDILANDNNLNVNGVEVAISSEVVGGSVVVNADYSITVVPDMDYIGEIAFTYQVCNGDNNCASATVVVIVNIVDTDLDDDGISNKEEGDGDTDGDGILDKEDIDSDNDSILDEVEGNVDTDGDGIPNYKDTDSDNDGISDAEEGIEDADGDGIPNYIDSDSDGDGISDALEGSDDYDNDGISNYLDSDSDNDGVSDEEEGDVDTDGDIWPDYLDEDSDNDGLLDQYEAEGDCDNDGIENRLDSDKCYGLDELILYEGFSPNNDGDNDTYNIPWLYQFNQVSIEIFNRWGNVVYKINKYDNNWNGESNVGFSVGKELPVGTYYYIINIRDINRKITGYIYLNR